VPAGFEHFYASELQGTWAQLPVPLLFLVYLALAGRDRAAASGRPDAGFVASYCALFALETLLDPVIGGPVARGLGLSAVTQAVVMFGFVWLGDLRVTGLVFRLGGAPQPWLRGAVWATLAPAADLTLYYGLLRSLWPQVPGQVLWLVHETTFLALALWMRAALVPRLCAPEPAGHRRFLRRALAYVAVYYALWIASDVLILAGLDLGWALRLLPNQLYYAFWTPFVFFAFFTRPSPP
jgi:hypothetical protein